MFFFCFVSSFPLSKVFFVSIYNITNCSSFFLSIATFNFSIFLVLLLLVSQTTIYVVWIIFRQTKSTGSHHHHHHRPNSSSSSSSTCKRPSLYQTFDVFAPYLFLSTAHGCTFNYKASLFSLPQIFQI